MSFYGKYFAIKCGNAGPQCTVPVVVTALIKSYSLHTRLFHVLCDETGAEHKGASASFNHSRVIARKGAEVSG